MYKATSRAEQFMTRTGSYSTHGTRGGSDLLGIGEDEKLDPIQRREALVSAKKSLIAQIQTVNEQLKPKLTFRMASELTQLRADLVGQLQSLDKEISAANEECGRAKKFEDMGHFIINVCREGMTRPQWAVVMKEARRRFDAQKAVDEAAQPATES